MRPFTKVMVLKLGQRSFEVTEVKKVIYTKIATFLTVYMPWSCDPYTHIYSRQPTNMKGQKVN